MSFKEYSMEGYEDSPSSLYPVREHLPEDGLFGASSGRLLGWRMHFPDKRWKGGELLVNRPLSEGAKLAELLFGKN